MGRPPSPDSQNPLSDDPGTVHNFDWMPTGVVWGGAVVLATVGALELSEPTLCVSRLRDHRTLDPSAACALTQAPRGVGQNISGPVRSEQTNRHRDTYEAFVFMTSCAPPVGPGPSGRGRFRVGADLTAGPKR